jgi:hypothetical protein
MGETLIVQVECYSDTAYADRPLAVIVEQKRIPVARVLAENLTPTGKHFRVELQDGRLVELNYEENEDSWRMTG